MKNIHVSPTDKPSRLWINNLLQGKLVLSKEFLVGSNTSQNIYITSDEEIKDRDWYYDLDTKYVKIKQSWENSHLEFNAKKIILTTDQDLIKDGVQAIDDEFLEWFVKNPSCKSVEVKKEYITPLGDIVETCYDNERLNYKIIIPKEETEQETLEEAALTILPDKSTPGWIDTHSAIERRGFIEGAKWQAERMYSEEEVREAIRLAQFNDNGAIIPMTEEEIILQFKKK